ncbi:MAG: hypothetical protein QXV69_05300 [Sulfolobaceae archaeon]
MNELDFLFNNNNNKKIQQEINYISKNIMNGPEDEIEKKMKEFLKKQPKIGVWSYPAFVLLQYLYSTVPGFKISKTAKEALELGLKQMYPELFEKAKKVCNSIK